ncbi:MAG: hypothetical protein Q8R79_04085 [Legionellaceae bacterium]|nr:hypothetical protein [Legionellaceae bacterium]
MKVEFNKSIKKATSYIISIFGALGTALQNYLAVDLFIRGIISGVTSMNNLLYGITQAIAIGFGGLCSGLVNFFINMDLLKDFLKRFGVDSKPSRKLEGWEKFRYVAGILVFITTGILFGLTAFTFGMTGPLAIIAIGAGVFVSIIMVIQEVETWLQSFPDELPDPKQKPSLKNIFLNWKNTLSLKKMLGHIIAAGNVIALSLLFTLGLAEVLMALSVAALPAFIVGVTISFTLGAFTEFYFYNFFLANFCHNIKEKWQAMKATKFAPLGFCCIGINALVNGALTYAGIGLLTGLLVLAGLAVPPVAVIIGLSAFCAVFASAASFILGMNFWIGQMTVKPKEETPPKSMQAPSASSFSTTDEPVIKHSSTKILSISTTETSTVPSDNASNSALQAPLVIKPGLSSVLQFSKTSANNSPEEAAGVPIMAAL